MKSIEWKGRGKRPGRRGNRKCGEKNKIEEGSRNRQYTYGDMAFWGRSG